MSGPSSQIKQAQCATKLTKIMLALYDSNKSLYVKIPISQLCEDPKGIPANDDDYINNRFTKYLRTHTVGVPTSHFDFRVERNYQTKKYSYVFLYLMSQYNQDLIADQNFRDTRAEMLGYIDHEEATGIKPLEYIYPTAYTLHTQSETTYKLHET